MGAQAEDIGSSMMHATIDSMQYSIGKLQARPRAAKRALAYFGGADGVDPLGRQCCHASLPLWSAAALWVQSRADSLVAKTVQLAAEAEEHQSGWARPSPSVAKCSPLATYARARSHSCRLGSARSA